MKVKYIGNYYKIDLVKGNIYEVTMITPQAKFYRLKDETGEEFDFPPEFFEIVEGSVEEFEKEDE